MKKNAMLKIAAVLLVAVLLTTCAISSTFAKYVSEGESKSDTARVAKWGLTIDSTKTSLTTGFSNNYDDQVVAMADDQDNLVAPGTKGQIIYTFTTTGTAEVDAAVRYVDADGETDAFLTCDESLDDELLFYIDGVKKTVPEINNYLGTLTKTYEAGTNAKFTQTITIDWIWAFDGDNNTADTTLGTRAVTEDVLVSFNIKPIIEQTGPAVTGAQVYPS